MLSDGNYVSMKNMNYINPHRSQLYVKNELLENDGLINLSKGNVATINGLDTYAIPKFKKQLSYQRPKEIKK